MEILLTRFRSGADFLARYEPSFAYGGLFVPTRRKLATCQRIVLDVRMPELRDDLLVRGAVAWSRRGKRMSGMRAGLAVEFLASERHKHDYLLQLARGRGREITQRRHRRLPVNLQCAWRALESPERIPCTVTDIGPGGAFIETRGYDPDDAPIILELTPPGSSLVQAIEARVVWRRQNASPNAAGNASGVGVGVEFRCRDFVGKQRLRELVRRLEEA